MTTKYVRRGLISLYVNFCNNRTMLSTNLHVKICRWGGKGKRAEKSGETLYSGVFFPPKMGRVIYYFEAFLNVICKTLENLRINDEKFLVFVLVSG